YGGVRHMVAQVAHNRVAVPSQRLGYIRYKAIVGEAIEQIRHEAALAQFSDGANSLSHYIELRVGQQLSEQRPEIIRQDSQQAACLCPRLRALRARLRNHAGQELTG